MAVQLSVHEQAVIAEAYALHFGRELTTFPELVEVWEDNTADDEGQAFNRHFALTFTAEPLERKKIWSQSSDVLPNTIGDTLFIGVDPSSLALLRVEFMGGHAPRFAYVPYAAQLQQWWLGCLADAERKGHHTRLPAWETLRRCVDDVGLFSMLRLMVIGEWLFFYGQVGAPTTDRTLREVFCARETGRQLAIRAGEGRTLAIDGYAPVQVTHTEKKRRWVREDDT